MPLWASPFSPSRGEAGPDALRKRRLAALLALALPVALTFWSAYVEPGRLVLKQVEIAVPNWPAQLDGLRFALMSDLHVGSPRHGLANLESVVRTVNAAHPDIVLIPGDLVIRRVLGGRFVEPEPIARELAKLQAPLGVYAVLGNHDWWYDAKRVSEALRAAGIPVLDDRSQVIEARGTRFWLAGVSDFWEGAHDIRAALADVPGTAPVILFTHNPDIFPGVPARVSLTVAGHTHGGQVRLPWYGPPVVPSRYGRRYAAGHVVERGRHLFVTTGLGTSILPVRFGVPPEVAILTLRPAAVSAAAR